MFLKKTFQKRTGRTYLSIAHGYRTPDKKSRTKTVLSIGYLDELEKEYANPVKHFTELARQMDSKRRESKEITISLDAGRELGSGDASRKNYGHVVYSTVYHELGIARFLANARRHENFRFNTDAIMRLLVFTRLLNPGSKRAAVLQAGMFFDRFDFSLDDVYNALTHFNRISDGLLQHLHGQAKERHGRETDLVYYDVTNYYFETDRQDELRKKGYSKEHRKDPIVQMGLLLDRMGLPISYRLFPGNTHDSQTLMPMLTEVKKKYGAGRIISVADKALNTGDNIAYPTILGDGYIYSKSVRGASEDFKAWVLDEKEYRRPHKESSFRLKSKVVPDAVINLTVSQAGKKKSKRKETVEQKWVVFFSEKYAKRAKHKREETIAKALKMIADPTKYRRTFDHGAAGYIENIRTDKETGELLDTGETLLLNKDRIAEEEKYDGYYAIATSELDDSDEHIVDTYRGLWRIEESFKVTKSVLGARPVYLRLKEHINAHFLVCFIALLIGRIVELRLEGKYTIAKIAETLRRVECSNIDRNYWLFDFRNTVTDDINAAFGTDFGRKTMTLKEIKKSLSVAKQG